MSVGNAWLPGSYHPWKSHETPIWIMRPHTTVPYVALKPRFDYEVHEGRIQTGRRTAHAGSRLTLQTIQKGTAWTASVPAVLGKTRRTE